MTDSIKRAICRVKGHTPFTTTIEDDSGATPHDPQSRYELTRCSRCMAIIDFTALPEPEIRNRVIDVGYVGYMTTPNGSEVLTMRYRRLDQLRSQIAMHRQNGEIVDARIEKVSTVNTYEWVSAE